MQGTIIIGGGISGLSTSYDLARGGAAHTLIEKQPRLGGVIETRGWENCVLECGPDSFLGAKPEAAALIQEIGLGSELIGSNDRERTTYILKRGRLVRLPDGVMMIVPTRILPMAATPLLGWSTKARMALEWFRRPVVSPDRSVAAFVTDHFGREALDYLAEPLLSGVYGGDPRQLSAACVLPRFFAMEAEYGSLVKGVLRARGQAAASGSLFRTLKCGLGTLVKALASTANVLHGEAQAIERREGGGFRVRVSGDWMEAEQVVLACPAWAAADLLTGVDGELARQLAGIAYSSSLILSLVYRAADFDGTRAGFGFLVPGKERRRLVACTFATAKFAHRAPPDRLVLRCFLGGSGDAAVLGESDEWVLKTTREELRTILGLTAAPLFHLVTRWPRSMAQYTVGHAARVLEIETRAAAIPGLHLAGNAYHGIGIPDCVKTGRQAAARILAP